MPNYDAFYRRLADLAVSIGEAERHAETLGFANTATKLQDMRASVNRIASNVMTKIEAEHIARMERRKHLTKRILSPALQTPGTVQCSGQRVIDTQAAVPLNVGEFVDHVQAAGLRVMLIDESTDFSKMPDITGTPGQPDPRTDGSVESPHADEPIDLAPPNDPPPPSE